jgi:hypothetical protein
MEEFPLCSHAAPGALSMTTLDSHQRSEGLSEKILGQKVHAHSDRVRCIFFALYFLQLVIPWDSPVQRARCTSVRSRDASR